MGILIDRCTYLSRSKRKHTRSSHHVIMVQLIGNFDFGALCLPTVPWGKSTRKMQFFRKDDDLPILVDSHGPSTRVRDGRWTYRTTVRCHEILRRRRRAGEYLGVATIRHRVFAHFIWSFYDFKLHSV